MTGPRSDAGKMFAERSELQTVSRNSCQRFLLAAKLLDRLENSGGLITERQRVEEIKAEAFMTFTVAQTRLNELDEAERVKPFAQAAIEC